jgi:molybdate transport system regulatory protein
MKKNRSHPDLSQALGHDVADKRIDILRRISETGSISQAARDAGVSYKAAWQAMETLTNLAGQPLVQKAVGGSGGGGASLTGAGTQLLHAADELARLRGQALSLITASGTQRIRLGFQTSMRNQFVAQIEGTVREGDAMRVRLSPAPSVTLHARITRESTQLLGLHKSMEITALCKATAVRLHASEPAAKPGINLLAATLTRLPRAGSASCEASVVLAAGAAHIVGFLTPEASAVRLRKADTVWAEVDESAIVLAL